MKFNQPNTYQPGACFDYYKIQSGDVKNTFVLLKQWTDPQLGMEHYRFQQYANGIPVEGAECFEHFKNGSLIYTHAKFGVEFNDQPMHATLTEEQAFDALMDNLPKKYKFAWESPQWEAELQFDFNDPNATYKPTGTLMYALDNFKDVGFKIDGARYKLCYKFTVLCLNPSFNRTYFVNALTGNIWRIDDRNRSDGSATIPGHGSQTIDTQFFGGFVQKNILHTNNGARDVHTKEFKNLNTAWSFTENIKDADDNWGTSQQESTMIHWFTSQSWDFFETRNDRIGMDGQGGVVRVYGSHPTDYYAEYENFDHGEIGTRDYIYCGHDGDGNYSGNAIDIVGHEFTHGVLYHTAGLAPLNEPGALGESFCDIFGVMIETYTRGFVDWTHGEDAGGGTRSLDNPKGDGIYFPDVNDCSNTDIGQPDTYFGDLWHDGNCDNGGIHVNGGVQNFWFFLTATGGTGTNDIGDDYIVQGVGLDDAALITYWSMVNNNGNAWQYSDARANSIAAATQLFGSCSPQEIAVIDAWYAVGIGAFSPCGPNAIEEKWLVNPFSVYPNPSSDKITIAFNNTNEYDISLYAIDGKLIQADKQLQGNYELDVNALSNGVYFIKVQSEGISYQEKIVVAHE